MTLIYLAGSSAEIERAERWRDRLHAIGHEVTSSWMANIRQVGAANPRDVATARRAQWAKQCLREVAHSDVLWFLVPDAGIATRGAWAELAFAYALPQPTVDLILCSGDTKQSIFCALGLEYGTDDAAFSYLAALVS